MQSYKTIGVMSGTSLDGLDVALCDFTFQNGWSFSIAKSNTIKYSKEWKNKLSTAANLSGQDLILLHKEYGRFIGKSVIDFLKTTEARIDFIASHGHTVFHQPQKKLTLQIGDGNEIAVTTKVKTISDFRSLDVALEGQGAPLVPIGDKLLFSDYDFCINIGGFANISFTQNDERLAYDICPANIILNFLANKLDHSYDKNGSLGRSGEIDYMLLNKLNALNYYKQKYPKSLGKEWLDSNILPILKKSDISLTNKIRTVYEHIAFQISAALQ